MVYMMQLKMINNTEITKLCVGMIRWFLYTHHQQGMFAPEEQNYGSENTH